MYQIEIIAKEKLDTILPLLEILNPKTTSKVLIERLKDIKETNYQCVGVYEHSNLIAISGIWILNKFYAGKHIEPDNVIVHPDYRNKGIGELMINWIHEYAASYGCLTSELNSRVSNEAGNKFWKRMGYEIAGYHFIKPLHNTSDEKAQINSCLSEHKSQ